MDDLITELIETGYLKTPAVINAFKKVDRGDFVPPESRSSAYLNQPLSIGAGQTISQPLTVAFMLELLELSPGQKVLDIGTGSGWQAALLAEIVGPKGRVVSLERIGGLAESASQNLAGYNFKNLELVIGDGSLGYPASAPYDRIVAAAAAQEIPLVWKKELKVGGVIVAPVGHSLVKLVQVRKDEFEEKEYPGFAFVPLVADEN